MTIIKIFMVFIVLILVAALVLTIVERACRPEILKIANLSVLVIFFAIFVGLLSGLINEVTTIFNVM